MLQNRFLEQMFYGMYPLLNFLLFVDLWWITKNPFYPQRKRNIYYLVPVVIMLLVSTTEFVWSCRSQNIEIYRLFRAYKSIINTLFSVISLLLILWIIVLLRRQGSKLWVSRKVLRRYYLSYVFMLPTIVFNVSNWYSTLIAIRDDQINQQAYIENSVLLVNRPFKYILYLSILIPLNRINESQVLKALQLYINPICGLNTRKKTNKKKRRAKDKQVGDSSKGNQKKA